MIVVVIVNIIISIVVSFKELILWSLVVLNCCCNVIILNIIMVANGLITC